MWWKEQIGNPYYGAIAQHYGLMTELLDITNDFNVAMFFANCVYEYDKNKWRPLTEKECRDYPYGYLYHAPAHHVDVWWDLENADKSLPLPKVMPIGYQPFYRCQIQTGYMLRMRQEEDFQNNRIFERLRFEHSVKMSQNIFDYMQQGRDIYPNEDFMIEFGFFIDKINSVLQFSTQDFEKAIAVLGMQERKEEVLHMLLEADFTVGKKYYGNIQIEDGIQSIKIPRQAIRRFNLKSRNRSPEKDNNITLSARMSYK